ncbi:MAG TPA: lytic transglycosylase domain-containing protein [Vicinamibacteria bacterium]|nr:lytic transglycosylase domain-containing protein [Vicinamibacteria bacterium]
MKRAFLAFALAGLGAAAAPARAEIALLANGQTFKVDRHRADGDLLWLTLRGGGEIALPAGHVRGFVPDEVIEEVETAASKAAGATAGAPELRRLASLAARRHGLDPELVLAVANVESAFRPRAVSPRGAQGLMQLMPGTARDLGVADPFDPAANLDGGTRYLRDLLAKYDGDLPKALAAYNAGPGAVARHQGVPPYKETRDYVRKVLRRYQPAPRE